MIVGHSIHGARFIKKLTGKSVRIHNTGAYLLTQKPDGNFNLTAPQAPTLEANLEVLKDLKNSGKSNVASEAATESSGASAH